MKGLVGKGPVIAVCANPGVMNRRPIAQKGYPQLLNAIEVGPPVLVVPALVHFINARLPVVNRRIAVLDPGRKQEQGPHSVVLLWILHWLRLNVLRYGLWRNGFGLSFIYFEILCNLFCRFAQRKRYANLSAPANPKRPSGNNTILTGSGTVVVESNVICNCGRSAASLNSRV